MIGSRQILSSIALGLTATCVSAKPLGFNSTSLGGHANYTTPTAEGSDTASVGTPSVVAAIEQSTTTTTLVYGNDPMASSAVGLQTIVVTETAAGCTLGSAATGVPSASASVNGQAPYAIAASSTLSASYAASTLLPAVHWDYPVDDIHNLAPSNSSNLYYSSNGVSDPSIQHLFATVSTTLMYESVVLDHSTFVANTSCSNDGIMVTFTSSEAFNFASTSWSASSSGFVLVTYTDGCHGTSDQQRTFWLINSLELLADSLSILANVETELAVESALHEVDLQWGTYYPTSNSTNGTTSGNSGSASSGSSSGSSNDGSGSGSMSGSGSNTSNSTTGTGSSSASSNSTTGSANGSACGNAPASVIDGLPAANCGDATFDAELDNAIGYLDFSSASEDGSSIAEFLPDASVSSTDLADAEDSAPLSQRSAVVSVAKTVVQVATAPVRLVAEGIRNIPVVGDFIAKQTELDPSISGSKDFNFGPDANADSPWGKAAEIYTKSKTSDTGSADVTIYCVDCGVKGHVAMAGQAKFNILDGLHGLTADLSANLEAGVNIGLVAHAQYSDTKTKALIRAPLPEVGVAVKGVFSAGVYLSVDAVSTVDVQAEGEALVGVVMTIPNFQATLNLFDQDGAGKSGVSGLTPTFQKRFEASGKVAASVRLALPIAINCGFEIPALSLKRAISLIEQPSLYGNLTVAASTANVAPASDTCNNGIEYFANRCKSFGSSSSAVSAESSATPTEDPTSAATTGEATAPATTGDADATPTAGQTTVDGTPTTGQTTADLTSDGSAMPTTTDDSASTNPIASDAVTTPTADSTAPTTTNDAASTADVTSQGSTDIPSTTTPAPEATSAGESGSVERRRAPFVRRDNSTMSTSSDDEVIANDTEDTFDATDNSDETNDAVSDDSSSADGTEFEADSNEALSLSADQQTEDGITFDTLIDIQKTFQVVPGTDGNLYTASYTAGSPSDAGLFASSQNVIIGDDEERVLHYYPDEMAAYNVSRIRLSSGSEIPKTADAIALSPIDYDNSDGTPSAYFAVTTKKDVYSLVLCNFANGADSKIFIVNDQSGIDTLQNNANVKFTVTGAPVKYCSPLAIVSGGNGTVSAS
ncbi:unnamed protein product [Aureobasidium uvarum]|uniref:DUF7029 domain-containing protein n=1 Tax=Aureobasidium uvarum TaxID=2773716 RepID=A0A9N8KE77_9PEZI|nr:unnamed protein product [Aureobasidium uvarum]